MDFNNNISIFILFHMILLNLFSHSIANKVTSENRCVLTCKIQNRNEVPCTVTEVNSVSVCTIKKEIRRLFDSTKLPKTQVSGKLIKRTSSTRTTYGLHFVLADTKYLLGFLIQFKEDYGVKSSKYYLIKLGRKLKLSYYEDFELRCVTTTDFQVIEYNILPLPSNKNRKQKIVKGQNQKQITKCFDGLNSFINRGGFTRTFNVKDAEEIGCISGCLKTNQLSIRKSSNSFYVEIFTPNKHRINISVTVTEPDGTVVDGTYFKVKINNFCCEDIKRTVEFIFEGNSTSLIANEAENASNYTVVNVVLILICVPYCIVTIVFLIILLYWSISDRLIKNPKQQGTKQQEQSTVLLITTDTHASNPPYTKAIHDLTELLKQYDIKVITLYNQSSHKMYNKYDWLEIMVRNCHHVIFVTSKDMYDLFKSKQENKGHNSGDDFAFYAFSVIRSESRLDKKCHVLSLCECGLKYSYMKEFSLLYSLFKKSTKICLTKILSRNDSYEIILNSKELLRLVNIITSCRSKSIHKNGKNILQYQYKLMESIKEYVCFHDRNTERETPVHVNNVLL